MVWAKTLFLFTVGPWSLSSNEYVKIGAFSLMIVFGTLGLYTLQRYSPEHEGRFVRGTRFVLSKMEASEKFNRIFTRTLRAQKRFFEIMRFLAYEATTPALQ